MWKVCGITSAADAELAVAAGADALGFVFWARSPRAVSFETAAAIGAEVDADVMKVGVFVDPSVEEIAAAIDRASLDIVQLCGDESPALCAQAPRPVWKALRLPPGTPTDVAQRQADAYDGATLLIDAAVPGEYGGTGELADWEVAAGLAARRRVVLAGGLRAGNVAVAVESVGPWGIDVSSGVESEPGRKDETEIKAFACALEPYR
jgi:phosphoribosylanthranilate isomerase